MSNLNQSFLAARNSLLICFAALVLTGCSGSSDTIDLSGNRNVHDAIDAATGPLEDLNLKRRDIPDLLRKAAADPYARPTKVKCAAVKEEVAKLDELLGPDVKGTGVVSSPDEEGFMSLANVEMPDSESVKDSAGNLMHDTVMGTIRSQTNIIPFRSIVRKITGADRHQKKVEAAYEAGKLRRAYLKGFAQERFGKRCLAPPVVVEAKAQIAE